MKKSLLSLWMLCLWGLLPFVMALYAQTRDAVTLTVTVSSAEHETQEGYFGIGDDNYIIVKPGSELYRFLSRQNGRRVILKFEEDVPRELRKIVR